MKSLEKIQITWNCLVSLIYHCFYIYKTLLDLYINNKKTHTVCSSSEELSIRIISGVSSPDPDVSPSVTIITVLQC